MPARVSSSKNIVQKPGAARPSRPAPKPARRSVFSGMSIVMAFGLALVSVWAFGATYLLMSGNRLASSAVSRAFQIQDFYEQQGAEYRRAITANKAEAARAQRDLARLEKLANDRSSVEGRIVELARRQTQIESRQSAILRVAENVSGAPIAALNVATAPAPPKRPSGLLGRARSILGMDADTGTDSDFELDPDVEIEQPDATVERRGGVAPDGESSDFGAARAVRRAASEPALPAASMVEAVSLLLQRAKEVEARQVSDLQALNAGAAARAGLLKQAADLAGRELSDIVEPMRTKAARSIATIARSPAEDGSPFGIALTNVRTNLAVIKRYASVVDKLPLRQPVSSGTRVTSRFGPRSDPFLGTARLHAGQDFAAASGTSIHSTGGGVVLSAGWGGGYGNLVQVDHGNGLVTRYAHMSEILVTTGQPVAAGQLLGKSGSTGRSTGPHLHYETRLHNVPNDPMRLMRVGAELGLEGSSRLASLPN